LTDLNPKGQTLPANLSTHPKALSNSDCLTLALVKHYEDSAFISSHIKAQHKESRAPTLEDALLIPLL